MTRRDFLLGMLSVPLAFIAARLGIDNNSITEHSWPRGSFGTLALSDGIIDGQYLVTLPPRNGVFEASIKSNMPGGLKSISYPAINDYPGFNFNLAKPLCLDTNKWYRLRVVTRDGTKTACISGKRNGIWKKIAEL